MSKQLKPLDYVTSLVATALWFLGGLLFLGTVMKGFLYTVPPEVRNNNKLTLGPLYLILLFVAFVTGVWLACRWLLPLFMTRTRQQNSGKTSHRFLALSALSILGLIVGDNINHKSLLIGYSFWAVGLIAVYLFARYQTID